MAWWNFLAPVVDLVKEPIKGWQERKTIKVAGALEVAKLKVQSNIAVANAKVEMAKTGQTIQADWDTVAQADMKKSWKDEVLMFIIFFPVITMFLAAVIGNDAMIDRMIKTVNALGEFPMWYQVTMLGIIAAVFGLRWLIEPVVAKMQKRKELIDKI